MTSIWSPSFASFGWTGLSRDSPLDSWRRKGGAALLASPEFKELLTCIQSGVVPGSGSDAGMRFLRERGTALHDSAMRRQNQYADAACQHVLLFTALLDDSSLEVAAAAFAALAASLQATVNRQRDQLLLELASQLQAALQRPGLVAEAADAKPHAAETIALHAFLPPAAARLQFADASIGASEVTRLGAALAAAAVPTVQHVLSADSRAELGHNRGSGLQLLAAAMLLDGATQTTNKAPPAEILASALALLRSLAHQLVTPAGRCSTNRSSSAHTGSGTRQQVLQDERAVLAVAAHHTMAAANSTAAKAQSPVAEDQPGVFARLVSGSTAQSETVSSSVFTPAEAADVLQVIGLLCVAAAAGSNQTEETGSSPTLAEELHCDRGWPLLVAALETVKPAAKWRLMRCVARLAAVQRHVSPAAAALLACVWDDTVSRMPPCAVPAVLSAAEAQAARVERLTVPAAFLQRCVSALEDDKSGNEAPFGHAGSQSSCAYMGAAAAMHSLSAAILHAAIIPGRLVSNSSDDGSGSSVGMHTVNTTSANAEVAPALQAACHPCIPEPRIAGHAGTSSGGQVAVTAARHTENPSGCADSSGDAAAADADAAAAAAGSGGCGAVPTARSRAAASKKMAAAGSNPAVELGATTAALADSGALSALSALFRLRDKAETRLATLAMLRQLPADEAAVLAELTDGKSTTPDFFAGHMAAANAVVAAMGLLEAEVAAGWVPPPAIVLLYAQAASAMLELATSLTGRNTRLGGMVARDAGWRVAATTCDFLVGLAAGPASAAVAMVAIRSDWRVARDAGILLLRMCNRQLATDPQMFSLSKDALWLLASAAAGSAQARVEVVQCSEEGNLASWEESYLCKALHRVLDGRAHKEVHWVDDAMRGRAPPPPRPRFRPQPAHPQPAAAQDVAAAAAAADAAMQQLLQEDAAGDVTAAGQSKSAKKRAARKAAAAAAAAAAVAAGG